MWAVSQPIAQQLFGTTGIADFNLSIYRYCLISSVSRNRVLNEIFHLRIFCVAIPDSSYYFDTQPTSYKRHQSYGRKISVLRR